MDRILIKIWINLILTIILSISTIKAEIWQGEFGKDVYIEATTEGLEAVHLRCYEDKMEVKIELEQPRSGSCTSELQLKVNCRLKHSCTVGQ